MRTDRGLGICDVLGKLNYMEYGYLVCDIHWHHIRVLYVEEYNMWLNYIAFSCVQDNAIVVTIWMITLRLSVWRKLLYKIHLSPHYLCPLCYLTQISHRLLTNLHTHTLLTIMMMIASSSTYYRDSADCELHIVHMSCADQKYYLLIHTTIDIS